MTEPIEILNELRARGVELCVAGDRLRFRPVDRVTPHLLARLREEKSALLEFLRSDPRNDLGVQAAEHMGALGNSARGPNTRPQWIVGSRLERLHESLQGLVMPRSGWTPEDWAAYLKRRAHLCDERHAGLAALYTQAGRLLETGSGGDPS